MSTEIEAEDLLSQNVNFVHYTDHAWHLLTGISEEENQAEELDRSEIIERLQKKIKADFNEMQTEFYSLSADELISRAEEINATRIVYNELDSGGAHTNDDLEFLLRFENPLAVARDKWIEVQCPADVSNEMNKVLRAIVKDPDIETEYDLDEEYEVENSQNSGMKML